MTQRDYIDQTVRALVIGVMTELKKPNPLLVTENRIKALVDTGIDRLVQIAERKDL